MTNKKLMVSALALTMAAGGTAQADVGTGSFSAGVALMSPEQTGFIYRGQLGVDGVGSGAVTVTSNKANHGFSGFSRGRVEGPTNVLADSGVLATFEFDRAVETSGSLAGRGNVLAFGEATGASGFTGAAFGEGERAGVTGGDAFSAAAQTESEAGLQGSVNTLNRLSLVGTGDMFAASQAVEIGEKSEGLSFAQLESFSGASGVDIAETSFTNIAGAQSAFGRDDVTKPLTNADGQQLAIVTGSGAIVVFDSTNPDHEPLFEITPDSVIGGVAFLVSSDLTDAAGASAPIDIAIDSAGFGMQSIELQTGGFFSGGAAGFGENAFGFAD